MKKSISLSKHPILSACYAAGLLFGVTLTSVSAQTVYTWNGSTGSWSNGLLWSTGSLPNSGAADVYIDGARPARPRTSPWTTTTPWGA